MSSLDGTPGENRTPDALLRTEALYPLSYRGRVLFIIARVNLIKSIKAIARVKKSLL